MGRSPDRARAAGAIIHAALIACALAWGSCSEDGQPSGGTSPGLDSPTPTVAPGQTAATVTRIVDGDTIHVSINGEDYRLRYIGIDAPEMPSGGGEAECLAAEATEYNRALVEGQTVGLETDVSETDRFGRLLRYVWLGDELVNAVLVRDGYARAISYPPDTAYDDVLTAYETDARTSRLGLWGDAC
jgi:endonuclease YncB( thermonuclease family)